METHTLEKNFDFFTARQENEILQIRFKENLLDHLIDFTRRDIVINFIESISKSDRIKVILLNSDFSKTGCEAYSRFIREKSRTMDRIGIHRLFNMTSQLILGIINLNRIVIHVCSGSVISLFLNVSLACDYRIASHDTIFHNPYLDLGMIPVGGSPFLLSKLARSANIWETLLLNRNIHADKALELGLVDRVVPPWNLDGTARETAFKFAACSLGTIAGLKRLVNFTQKDLKGYFEMEEKEIFRIIDSGNLEKEQ
ncbi:enoyl-CoA hydratase/isomerase family protein [Desulfospira joergensenii]|uniref:enoyl-CoA hydratase/isomerase family protein n=1 Tax=Desulfospira joergensenii TaxID=53329 RepID=UPI0003B52DE6|nr:enoyl-CoA hydratase/isomerase family protein [Desulfospira joergensenii]